MKRSNFQICKSIFEALLVSNPLYKSELREKADLGAESIDRWVDLITFIQSQPTLNVLEYGRHQLLELEKTETDVEITPEALVALKRMKNFLDLSEEEIEKRLKAIGC